MYQEMNHKRTFTLLRARWLCAVVLLTFAMGVGANPDGPAAGPVGPDTLVVDPNFGQIDPVAGRIKFVAFQQGSNIRDGLRLLAALCQKNIVPSSGVDGPLTISRLYDVTFEEALDAILGFGFKYVQDGNFVRVYTAEQYRKIQEDPSRMEHRVITLYYVTADEAAKLVQPVLSGAPSARVQTSSPAEMSISSGEGTLSSGGGGNNPANHDMIIVFDYPENVKRAEAVIREIDVRPRQVLIEATIMTVRLNEQMQFGIDWNLFTGTPVTDFPANLDGRGTAIETFGFAQRPPTAGLTVGFSAGNVQAIITALDTVTDTTVLANPKILAVNKQEGAVLIGTKLGYLDTTTQTQTSTTQSVAFLETGTRLAFRPYIGNDGYIRMDIYPKDSDGNVDSQGLPTEVTTELRTNVIVRDGETVILGGLFRDTIATSRSQVPLLGDLPLVGALFRGTRDEIRREEVIILLTPHIIGDPAETRADNRIDDVRRKRQGARDALQTLSRSKIAEDAYAKAARHYLEGDLEQAVRSVRLSLMMRPTYLEALRLRERIIAETDPEEFRRLDSIVMEEMDEQEAQMWLRR